MAVNSVGHSFLCNNVILEIDESEVNTTTAILLSSKILNTFFSLCSQRKFWLSVLEIANCMSEQQTGKTRIRLFFQKQSDLGLRCLSRHCLQAVSVQNFRTSIVVLSILWLFQFVWTCFFFPSRYAEVLKVLFRLWWTNSSVLFWENRILAFHVRQLGGDTPV